MKSHAVGLSDIGRVRQVNQDAFGIHDALNLCVIADGMGGHVGGEIASRLAVDTITQHLETRFKEQSTPWPDQKDHETILCEALESANHAIRSQAKKQRELSGMGTTAVTLHITDQPSYHATIAHAGDSRAYLIRNQTISLLTRDHSLIEERIELGIITPEQALTHPLRHVLTKALGIESYVNPAVKTVELQPTDVLILCTDGLTKMMADERILQIALGNLSSLEQICKALVGEANKLGGDDNVTIIAVTVRDTQ